MDSFGLADPGDPVGAKEFAGFIESKEVTIEGEKPNRFAWFATVLGEVKFEFKAESRRGVTDWISRHFPKDVIPQWPLRFPCSG